MSVAARNLVLRRNRLTAWLLTSSRCMSDRIAVSPFNLTSPNNYIGGKWVPAISGKTTPVHNPATAEVIATVADSGEQDTKHAVAAAVAGSKKWAATTAMERSALIREMGNALLKNSDSLAALLTMECGKPFEEAKGEIAYSASFFEWFAEEAKRSYGDITPAPRVDRRILAIRQPIGVCALLTPWNFPSAMIARKLAPAMAAGCTSVVRPSMNTPLSTIAMVQLAHDIGVPAGVINLILGHDHEATAGALCEAPEVRKLSFTGSTPVGSLLMKKCSGTLKKLSLELGGNAPFIVFEDADVDAAVEGCIASKFRNAGQTCVCANRIYVHASVYDAFKTKLADAVSKLKVGNGMTKGVHVGPLISASALHKTETLVKDALKRGAVAITGGERAHGPGLEKGFFYKPTVLENVPADCRVVREEIFGPVAPLVRFNTEAEVIEQCNSVDVGLAGYFYSNNLHRVWRVAEALEVGMVGVNTGIISTAAAPFGGVKMSGFGREGSKYGLDEYTSIKYIMLGIQGK